MFKKLLELFSRKIVASDSDDGAASKKVGKIVKTRISKIEKGDRRGQILQLRNEQIVVKTTTPNVLNTNCGEDGASFSPNRNKGDISKQTSTNIVESNAKLDSVAALAHQTIRVTYDDEYIRTGTEKVDENINNTSNNTELVDDQTDDTQYHKRILNDVAEFYQQFSHLSTDVRVLISKNVVVYVLGTNHANNKCKDDVVEIISMLQPKTVLVELCSLRACSCKKHKSNAFQSTPKFTFRYLRSIITQLGFLPAMIFFTDVFREHLVSENSYLHYGGEFVAAMVTAQSLTDCRIILADRPIEITVKRQASAMGNWRGLRVTLQVTLALLMKRKMKQLILSANRLIFDDPKTYEILVFERDLFLTYSIQEAAKVHEKDGRLTRIVAVIGQGHMKGIQTYWGKVPCEFIPFILSPLTLLDR